MVECTQGGLQHRLAKPNHLAQGADPRPPTDSRRHLDDRALLLRQAIQTGRDHALDARRDSQIVDGVREGKVAPLTEQDTGFLEPAANLFDEERDVRRMRNDPVLQFVRRRGKPEDVVQHRPARALGKCPQGEDLGVALSDPGRQTGRSARQQHEQVGRLQRGKRRQDRSTRAIDPMHVFDEKHGASAAGRGLDQRAACVVDGLPTCRRLQFIPLIVRDRQVEDRVNGRPPDRRHAFSWIAAALGVRRRELTRSAAIPSRPRRARPAGSGCSPLRSASSPRP